jgi:hypothetical protein
MDCCAFALSLRTERLQIAPSRGYSVAAPLGPEQSLGVGLVLRAGPASCENSSRKACATTQSGLP